MEDIYREHILDHYGNPRNWGELEHPDIVADADDPSCGDQVHLELALDAEGRVAQVAFQGEGCIVSMASSSMFTEFVKGRSLDDLAEIDEQDVLDMLGVLVGAGRRRCAISPLTALRAGLNAYRKQS